MKKIKLILSIGFLLLGFSSGLAFAATVAVSDVQLTNITFEITGDLIINYDHISNNPSDPTIWDDESYSYASAGDSYNTYWEDSDGNNFAATSAQADTSYAHASSQTTVTTSGGNVLPSGLSSHGDTTAEVGNLWANTSSWAGFWLAVQTGSSGGTLTISADYSMTISGQTDADGSAYAYADVQLGGDIWPNDDNAYQWDPLEVLTMSISESDSFTQSLSGTKTVEMDFGTNNTGHFWWEIESYTATELNSVPIPSTLALFGFGLLSLVGVNRRKK